MSESGRHLESILLEERSFPPPQGFAARARLSPAQLEALQRQAQADHAGFWAQLARREIAWQQPFTTVLDESQAPNYGWFTDGRLNVSYNCLDVHLEQRGDQAAVIFEGEPGDTRRLSYRQLHAEVCRFANALKAQGVERGDRVVIYMPMVPEALIAMHACARIGAIHSVVFGGFSALSLRDRIEDAGAKLLVTADGGWRGGRIIELKAAADKALAQGCPTIEKVIVYRRTQQAIGMDPQRDLWWHEVVEDQPPVCEPEWVGAEHPLFVLYTSGSTGKPKGIQHSSAGFLLGAKLSTKWALDTREDDVFWCTADVGWVTGHSYVTYGPLSLGATVVVYEGGPTWPDGGRFWKICQDHGVSIFYTAPTAIRALMRLGDALPARYDLSRLRLLGSVGEPINPEAWMWYQRVIGGGRCPVVDTWWQTETGAIMIAPVPGVTPTKPGSCTLPLPGIEADIVDERGDPVTRADAGGYLVIRKPWPSMLRTIWGDNERYLQNYWGKFQNRFYVAGDSAHRDREGYFWIMGRIDDVLNVAGHRLGTMEIESALVAHPRVAEAAVVGRPHEVKGESVFAYVVCRGSRPGDVDALARELRDWVGEQLGAIAKPDDIRFTDNLPKTRSGKIMRRLLRAVARGEDFSQDQDVSTLENPAIIDQLRGADMALGGKRSPRQASSPAAAAGASGVKQASRTRPVKPARKTPRKKVSTGAVKRAAAPEKAPARKAPARKAPARKASARKAAARKAAARKAAARKAPARKGVARTATARKTPAGRTAARKAATRKTPARKPTARKSVARKAAGKVSAKKAAGRTSARKAPGRKNSPKRAARRTSARKVASKKTPARSSAGRRASGARTGARRAAVKHAAAKRAVGKRSGAKRTAAKGAIARRPGTKKRLRRPVAAKRPGAKRRARGPARRHGR